MLKSIVIATWSLALLIGLGSACLAASPQDRAAKLKEWREKCNDPDPDLRLAQFEAAIATSDVTVMRTCIRQALRSDQSDMRNLGLRAALSMRQRITFQMSLPDVIKQAQAKSGSNQKRDRELRRTYGLTLNPFDSIGGIFTFVRERAEVTEAVSQWSTLGINPDIYSRFKATMSVTGDRVSATGNLYVSGDNNFRMQLRLNNVGELVGTIKLGRSETFPVQTKLF